MAIVVPNVDVIKSWAMENNIPGTLTVLCNDANVKELIVADMLAWGKEGGLKSFEQVRFVWHGNRTIKLLFVGTHKLIVRPTNAAMPRCVGGGVKACPYNYLY